MQKLIGVSKLARAADVSDDTIRRLITSGKLKAIKVGYKFVIPESEANRLLGGAYGVARRGVCVRETAMLTPQAELR